MKLPVICLSGAVTATLLAIVMGSFPALASIGSHPWPRAAVIPFMDGSLYKDFVVSRGYNYHYYVSSAPSGDLTKPTLVFIHGFGIGSKDWRHQVDFFVNQGYRVLAPDMLGYAGSSVVNGVDYNALKYSLLVKDIAEIMDREKVNSAVFVAQGGGSPILSRLTQLYPQRVRAAAFLSVPYTPPNPSFNYTEELKREKAKYGHELTGFHDFYANDAAVVKIVANHFDAFFTILYPNDPKSWAEIYGPLGKLREYILSGKILPSPSWFSSEEDKQFEYDRQREQGRKDQYAYSKAIVSGLQATDDAATPADRYIVPASIPVLFGAALDDYVSLAAEGKDLTQKYCKNATIRDFKTGHWVHLQRPGDVNEVLRGWFRVLGF
ncbi:hypothetical protein PQX77_008781 [Marasmius sp. AFHP31]|nr:hypothetical protein PQX77_008781 [Marasmius sp. AFHP31]